MEMNLIIEKLQAATAEVNSTGTAMVTIFAEDKVAAREYINDKYRLERYGTYRFLNKADNVCYDIIGINENHRRNYTKAVYFDGSSLKNKNELLAQFAINKVEEAKPAVEAITSATTEAIENISATIPVYQTTNIDIEKAVLSAPLINEKPTKRRRKPTVFEESESTTDGENE